MISVEAEVPILFLSCFILVYLLKVAVGTSLVWKQPSARIPWFGHLICELLSFFFFLSVLSAGRLFPLDLDPSMYSEHASVYIGLFGVFWAFSVFLLLDLMSKLRKK